MRFHGQLLFCGTAGMLLISSKSMSAFHLSRIPGRCPAPTTATTFDALLHIHNCTSIFFFPEGDSATWDVSRPCSLYQK